MKKSALALTTTLSLLAFTPAFAETAAGVDPACMMTAADGTQSVDMTKCPDGKTMMKSDNSSNTGMDTAADAAAGTESAPAVPADQAQAPASQPADGMTSDQATPTTTAEQPTDASAPAAETATTTLTVPADALGGAKIMSASDYIGKRVYDTAGNDIGEVNDLIISEDGKVQATILGVGGFLGIGEKDVAVPVTSVEMVKDGESVKLVVNATKDQLEKAPKFDASTRNYAG